MALPVFRPGMVRLVAGVRVVDAHRTDRPPSQEPAPQSRGARTGNRIRATLTPLDLAPRAGQRRREHRHEREQNIGAPVVVGDALPRAAGVEAWLDLEAHSTAAGPKSHTPAANVATTSRAMRMPRPVVAGLVGSVVGSGAPTIVGAGAIRRGVA